MSPAPVIGQRVDQGYAHVVIGGRDCGLWPVMDGGGMSAPSNKQRLLYGLPEVEAGGPTTVSDVTLDRPYVAATDADLWDFLYARCGKAEGTVTRVYQDAEGVVVDRGRPRSGKLLVVNEPPLDVNSQDEANMHIELGMHGTIG
jgi:hypothetical protein